MNTENRDFVIERLERQLKEKETEIDDIKTNLRDSILREIRSDLKNDLDIHNRIAQLERKVQALSNNLNGVMDELLDQKSMLRSLGESPVSREKKAEKPAPVAPEVNAPKEPATPKLYRPEAKPVRPPESSAQEEAVPATISSSAEQSAPNAEIPSARPVNSRVSVRSDEQASMSGRKTAHSSNVNFNVREIPSVKKPEMPEPEHRSEYIIAETDDERKLRLAHTSRQEAESCNYIVAEEDKLSCKDPVEEYETVEAREDEDAVVVTTRRK
ncbi:MAG: hypothetical protein R2741_10220 [Methanolobus sp.]